MKNNMKHYKNYVFDLYGTLVDIHTNEMSMQVWKTLAGMYEAYGAYYTPAELRKAYLRVDQEEREKIRKKDGYQYPENRLEVVFLRLLLECPKRVGVFKTVPAGWGEYVANSFRVLSRSDIRLYPETLKTLQALKESGSKLYLLSNAQAIFTRPEIVNLGLEPYFAKIYLSSDYRMMKPEPAFFEILLEEERLNPDETVMVGNEIRSDIKVADACNVPGILINIARADRKILTAQAKAAGIHNPFLVVSSIGGIL